MWICLTLEQSLDQFQISLATSQIQGRFAIPILPVANELGTTLGVHMALGVVLDEEAHAAQVRRVPPHQVLVEQLLVFLLRQQDVEVVL
jgi:hypothetical protein